MKFRRITIICTLVLLAMVMVVVPVQAGRSKTTFVAWNTSVFDENHYSTVVYTTGGAEHRTNTFTETVTSGDPRFQGTMIGVHDCAGPGMNHPQADWVIGMGWGPCNGTWKLDVPGLGRWEGQAHGWPQADFRVGVTNASGKGYGQLAGMKIEWTIATLDDFMGGNRTVTITAAD